MTHALVVRPRLNRYFRPPLGKITEVKLIRRCSAALLLAATSLATPAVADVFVLNSGGRIEGELLSPAAETPQELHVRTSSGDMVLPADLVAEVIEKSPQLRNYEAILPQMPPDVEGNWKMAQWCATNQLPEQRERHLQNILAIDPNHEQARHALGYINRRGEWIITDQWFKDQGMIRHERKWMYPQDVAMAERAQKYDDATKEWRVKLRQYLLQMRRGGDKAAKVQAEIAAIQDPLATQPLIELLQDDKYVGMRETLIDALGNLVNGPSTLALTKVALEDPNASIRDRATIVLEKRPNDLAVAQLMSLLHSKDNTVVNRAASVLARLKHPAAIDSLIDTLVTSHQFKVTQGSSNPGETSASFGSGSSGGFSFGSSPPKIITQEMRNEAVLRALMETLQAAELNANFGYDEAQWKHWNANRQAPPTVDLRRDG
ncbi:HEAT repeat domain-containing protein [Blastopirellula sp. JC732]|uniref:HEAT repeat domain-containing protein n=1 Tax=Blastopirellula sediminis TaxID=2894196 RepID=A0A9X1ML64_9BACT|nr:HEAT repeat domain-containing protein [Blastopirellula sediminis]MCC9609286.1 HEAT repeat domain-containing protein [Blastopirellula sediminis]MCC9627937.1 HEAT repeat domain-containing protein [Blastopirellula sediminis]